MFINEGLSVPLRGDFDSRQPLLHTHLGVSVPVRFMEVQSAIQLVVPHGQLRYFEYSKASVALEPYPYCLAY